MSDLELMSRIARGDSEAFNFVYRNCNWKVRRELIGCRDAEDIAQEVWIRFLASASQYRDVGSSIDKWVCRIAKNLAIDTYRRSTSGAKRPLNGEVCSNYEGDITESVDSCDQLDDMESSQRIQEVMHKLPEKFMTVMQLHYLHGMTLSEIAEKLQKKLPTIKSRLRLGREKIRDYLHISEEQAA